MRRIIIITRKINNTLRVSFEGGGVSEFFEENFEEGREGERKVE